MRARSVLIAAVLRSDPGHGVRTPGHIAPAERRARGIAIASRRPSGRRDPALGPTLTPTGSRRRQARRLHDYHIPGVFSTRGSLLEHLD